MRVIRISILAFLVLVTWLIALGLGQDQEQPNSIQSWWEKGDALFVQGKYDEAVGCMDKVLEIDPNDATALANKGEALLYLGKYDEAIQSLDKAIKINPKNTDAWGTKGASSVQAGEI